MSDHVDSSVLHQMIGDREPTRLLVVDDEDTVRLAIARFLRSRGHEVESAASADDALALLRKTRFAAMVCDVRMPGMSGVDLIPMALELDPDLAVVMLTAVTDSSVAAQSLSRGAGEYLVKPVALRELEIAVERALSKRTIAREQRDIERLISDEVDRHTAALRHERAESYSRFVQSLALTVELAESNDPYFARTAARVTAIAAAIADVLKLDQGAREHLNTAALLHDIGRLATRDALLHKSQPLEPAEVRQLREHVRLGLEVLSPLIFPRTVLHFVSDHHEHWDGTGYPSGRSGERLSIGGRILAATDALVSLTSKRPYREPIQPDEALELLANDAGTQFDPTVLRALGIVVTEQHVLGLTG
ncbi:MAG: Cyclic di-GMP phosphodiesterase [Gemmatimonadaceae bacterium]|nr:Cyclic di-GMP phosphodiesterase [Gemmatimonadaceae bacterium]